MTTTPTNPLTRSQPPGIEIEVKQKLDAQFVSDCLVTAFDGVYGGCWDWAEPQTGSWLTVHHLDNCPRVTTEWHTVPPECSCGSDTLWVSCAIRRQEDYDTGSEALDDLSKDGFLVDAHVIQTGIQRIITRATPIRQDLEQQIVNAVLEGCADIDAHAIDCVVQAGYFGKVIWS